MREREGVLAPTTAAPESAPRVATPTPAAPSALLDLQRSAGNQATVALLQRKGGTGLPAPLKAGIESLSGYSMDDVRVHSNSGRPAQLNALAYAQGDDIHLAPGQERHLPHEAWHVVQQRQGRVRPGMPDPALAVEADEMGAKAARHTPSA